MKAIGAPPCRALTLDQSPEKIANRLGFFSAAWSMIGVDQWVLKTVMQGYQISFVQFPPMTKEPRYSPHLSPRVGTVEVAESGSAGDAGQGCDRAGLLQPPFLGTQEWGTVEADHRSVSPQRLHRLPELHYGDSSVNSQGPKTRPMVYVPGFERRLLSNRDSSSRQTVPPFLSQRHLAVQSTAFWSLNQSKSFYQNTQTGTSLCPFTRGKVTPGFSSGSSRANILAQVPVPKIRAGHKSGEVGFNPFPESHLSGNRAGLPCTSGKTVRQESDQMDLHSGVIHSSAVTTRCSMAPGTGTLSFPRETSTL